MNDSQDQRSVGKAGRPEEEAVLKSLGFPSMQPVAGRLSIADLYASNARCGVYVLRFRNGEHYAGQAVDVSRRFGDHRKTHGDIEAVTFQAVRKRELDEVERHVIHTLEGASLRMRNIAHMSVVEGERDLDALVTPEEQNAWLAGNPLPHAEGAVDDPDLRRRYRSRFESYRQTEGSQEASLMLGLYLQRSLPRERRTELSFWAVSCLPTTRLLSPDVRVLYRVNLNMMEVFTASQSQGQNGYSFHLARSPLEQEWGEDWPLVLEDSGLEVVGDLYVPGGHDQASLFASSAELAFMLLEYPVFLQAVRLMNLRLMRKGPTYYAQFHCFDLADEAREVLAREEAAAGQST